MQEYTLTRTDEIPVKLPSAELIGSTGSRNSDSNGKESSSKQWFTIDIYRTAKGMIVAHVKYRAGSRLGHEEPCDTVLSAPSWEVLLENLKVLDPVEEFVVGWPGDGSPDENNGRDYTENDRSVCKHAESEWFSLIERSSHLFGSVEEIA